MDGPPSAQQQNTFVAFKNCKRIQDARATSSNVHRQAKRARMEERNPSHYLMSLIEPRVFTRKTKKPIPGATHASLLANYDKESVTAIRKNDIPTLRKLLSAGKCFDACNMSGETLLHLACRRGSIETVTFLLKEAGVDVNVHDELGRTVLHDICWRPTPHVSLMGMLVDAASVDLLLVEDARGHCCFDYCRKEHWLQWNDFLEGYANNLRTRLSMIASSAS